MSNPLITKGLTKAGGDLLSQPQRPVSTHPQRGRLTFGMDATASRQDSWDMATKLQVEMFRSAGSFGGLELQLVFYRGYDECQASKWVTDTAELTRLMTSVTCKSGPTQIARILRYVASAARKTNALVFVGDCMEEDHTTLVDLATRLGAASVPVFMFQEGNDPHVSHTFEMVALASGGAFCSFDAAAADRLKQLLGAVAAYASGGREALLAYEKAQAKLGAPALRLTDQMDRRK